MIFDNIPECGIIMHSTVERKTRNAPNISPRKSRAVMCITTKTRYKSALDASAATGLHPNTIAAACRLSGVKSAGYVVDGKIVRLSHAGSKLGIRKAEWKYI